MQEILGDRAQLRFTDEAGLPEAVDGAQVLFLWDFFSTAVRDAWEHCQDLEWIHVAAAGVDTLVFPALAESEVVVTNAKGIFDRPIAEYVLGAVLAHAKRVHESHELQRRHEWRHRETRTVQGARAMVIGTGGIGREIGRLLAGAGLEVSGAGRTAREGDPDLGTIVPSSELADHLGEVDYLVNAAPLTPATTGLIDAGVLAALPERAHLVNIGRGESVVEEDLVAALRAGQIDGATLDVFAVEPLPPDSPLWTLPGVVVTPHMSGDAEGWRDRLAQQFVANAERWLAGEELVNIVDTRLGYVPSSQGSAS
ncbi:D-2-hydroxyacid dehydrogenase [Ornithinicoccus halotolerans]|uniref:D-2-hydroxyacid dehydrogenase n=1 Tax=Ornithinicoccus halotolerans TaxID=1748220 RepID=UPI001E2A5B5B|nr:D-2-hydroxyacid dehydrogenase [Ornithinicoccus halotolerans]